MVREMSITTTREKFLSIGGELENTQETIAVTKRGKPVLALMSWDLYKSVTETLAIMGDASLMKKLRQSIKEAKAGKLIPFEDVFPER